MTTHTATGTFSVSIRRLPAEGRDERWARMSIGKVWHGGVEGTGTGQMLTAGDPTSGSAGYVAMEAVEGTVDGRAGTFCMQQMGTLTGGESRLTYEVVPGSGTGALEGMTGTLDLQIDEDGTHRYTLEYALP